MPLDNIEVVVLDEADRMLDMGFKEDVEQIVQNIQDSISEDKNLQIVLFSATMPPWVHKMSQAFMKTKAKFFDFVGEMKNKTPRKVQHLAIHCD